MTAMSPTPSNDQTWPTILQQHLALVEAHSQMLYKLKKHVKLIIKSSTESHNASRAERQRIDQLLVQAEQLHADARSVGFVYDTLSGDAKAIEVLSDNPPPSSNGRFQNGQPKNGSYGAAEAAAHNTSEAGPAPSRHGTARKVPESKLPSTHEYTPSGEPISRPGSKLEDRHTNLKPLAEPVGEDAPVFVLDAHPTPIKNLPAFAPPIFRSRKRHTPGDSTGGASSDDSSDPRNRRKRTKTERDAKMAPVAEIDDLSDEVDERIARKEAKIAKMVAAVEIKGGDDEEEDEKCRKRKRESNGSTLSVEEEVRVQRREERRRKRLRKEEKKAKHLVMT